MATRLAVAPTRTEMEGVLRVMPVTATALLATVTWAEADLVASPLEVAVMVTGPPAVTPVTMPVPASTLAMAGLPEDQLTVFSAALLGLTVATRDWVWPTRMLVVVGLTLTEETGMPVTVIVLLSEIVPFVVSPEVAVTVAVPGAFADIRPELFITTAPGGLAVRDQLTFELVAVGGVMLTLN